MAHWYRGPGSALALPWAVSKFSVCVCLEGLIRIIQSQFSLIEDVGCHKNGFHAELTVTGWGNEYSTRSNEPQSLAPENL